VDAGEVPDVRLIGTFEFSQLLRRAELPPMTKLVAFAYVSYASPDGGRIWPGERRVADELDLTERAVRGHVGVLRMCGLLMRVRAHSPGRAAEYALSWPLDPGRMPMRVDPEGWRLVPRVVRHRNPGSGVKPVDNLPQGNVGSGVEPTEDDPQGNESSGDAPSPEAVSSHTGTWVPGTPEAAASGQLPELPRSGPNTSGSPEVTTSRGVENGHPKNAIDPSLQPPTVPTPESYAEARDVLIKLPDFGVAFMEIAQKQYAAEGWRPLPSQIVAVRAALLAGGTA
jgi:hypothetical protein